MCRTTLHKTAPAAWLTLTLLLTAATVAAQPAESEPALQSNSAAVEGGDSASSETRDILDLSLEQLTRTDVVVPALDTVVTTVSRQVSTVGRSPAAVFVITPDMIRRSGATCIPEALRMAPGVEVARIDANKWAISIRGFNERFANKLLVQIDGRAVYTPLFGGVYWDVQDVVLQDVERIEVIRGPGGTVWGSNAVNGVINIITKQAKDTLGELVVGGVGTEERAFGTVRHGEPVGETLHWRVYGKEFERDTGFAPVHAADDWRQVRTGFRTDWTPNAEDTVNFQGDFYNGYSGTQARVTLPSSPLVSPAIANYDEHVSGGNGLVRWSRVLDDDTDWRVQFYYDRTERHTPILSEDRDTIDIDFQNRFPFAARQEIIWGCGYRCSKDFTLGNFNVSLDPPSRTINLYSCFIQDEFTLDPDRWYLTIGSKFEENSFTGFEYQPSVRLLFLPSDRQSCWAAISRAVRLPSRFDDNARINTRIRAVPPTFLQFRGNPAVQAEDLLSFELGYREQPNDRFSWDIAGFYNDYEDLIGVTAGLPFRTPQGLFIPTSQANVLNGEGYGVELSGTYDLTTRWKLRGAYSYLQLQIHGSDAGSAEEIEGLGAHNRLHLWSSWDLGRDVEFDLIGRYVDNLPVVAVPSYFTLDARLGWRPRSNLELALVGQNLLDSRHLEFVPTTGGLIPTEVQSGFYGMVTATF